MAGGGGAGFGRSKERQLDNRLNAARGKEGSSDVSLRGKPVADEKKFCAWGAPNPTKWVPPSASERGGQGEGRLSSSSSPSKSKPNGTDSSGTGSVVARRGSTVAGATFSLESPPPKGHLQVQSGGAVPSSGAAAGVQDLAVQDELFELKEDDVKAGWKKRGKLKNFLPSQREASIACYLAFVERIILGAYRDASPGVRKSAIAASHAVSQLEGECGASWHTGSLVRLLADPSPNVRLSAVVALRDQCKPGDVLAMWGQPDTWTVSLTLGVSSLILCKSRPIPVRSFVRLVRKHRDPGQAAWQVQATLDRQKESQGEKLFPFVDDLEGFPEEAKNVGERPADKKWENLKRQCAEAMALEANNGIDADENGGQGNGGGVGQTGGDGQGTRKKRMKGGESKGEADRMDEVLRTSVASVDWRVSGLQEGIVSYQPVSVAWDVLMADGPKADLTLEVWEAGPRGTNVLIASAATSPSNLLAPERPIRLMPRGARIMFEVRVFVSDCPVVLSKLSLDLMVFSTVGGIALTYRRCRYVGERDFPPLQFMDWQAPGPALHLC